ncbi:MAG: trypsin-like peptidase domain-containing protein [Oscillospiraceae bacterium]|nr:trypsin-like peptidase domain-containing protein [Oscillospiraceae bacterium]
MDNEFEKELYPEEPVTPPEEDTTYHCKPEFSAEYVATPIPEPAPRYNSEYRYNPPPKPKKKGHGKRMVALGLVCAIIGGVCGMGGTLLGMQLLSKGSGKTTEYISGVLQGQRENSVIKIEEIDTSKLLTPAEVYAANVNATVSINATGKVSSGFWGGTQTAASAGSGFILTGDGYVVTNYHVIESMDTITVTLYDKRQLSATLVGYDESNDIAVLKVEGENLTPVVLGDSDNLNVGDNVVAIGNPLGELSFTLTAGYISAKDRAISMSSGSVMTLLQTDCPINSGNSGGALFNMYGEVIGITNAKYSNNGNSSEASIDNIGFAIPMNKVKSLIFSIIEKGVVTKPYIGISIQNVTSQMQSWGIPNGAWVVEVETDGPAAQGGLRVDDIITHMNGEAVTDNSELVADIGACTPGESIVFTVYRGGKTMEITVVVGEKVQATS